MDEDDKFNFDGNRSKASTSITDEEMGVLLDVPKFPLEDNLKFSFKYDAGINTLAIKLSIN